MKKTVLAALAAGFLFSAVFSSAASADWYKGCKKKEQILLGKIEYAKRYGHHNQLIGLEKALREVRARCTEDSMSSKADSKIWEKRAEVDERQQDLDEAIREGARPDKVRKRQRKLEEARAELSEAMREREALR